ncbi:unnamed protein product [Staurois parvus]|uniref:Uncharacterized protein n=1 Tax=Staurois parvus TaxID=386267 RepID=A0ABN9C9U1_9NEOB|nr:unnamed protein product [Staurois parvus]
MGPCTASSCCCQARNLPWAPVPPPHAAARPVICHGPLYRLLMLLPGPESSWAPYRSPHAAARPVICHGPLYRPPSCCCQARVCHGSLYGLPLLLPGP